MPTNTESTDTIKILSHRDGAEELFQRLSGCYQNISRNVNLMESQSKINKQDKIPLTLQSMIYEFYLHALIGYLTKDSVGFIWDQLFLHNDWGRLKEIMVRILTASGLLEKITANQVEDAVNLYRVVREHLRGLTVADLKCVV